LGERGASFVTLAHAGRLRGCVGSVRARRALGEDIDDNAVAAASRDPRFAPLTAAEFDAVRIEVSLLSRPQMIERAGEAALLEVLRPGEHGVILHGGCRSATFLPQVWAQLPEPARFLGELKRKAGLAPDHPGEDLLFATFTVEKWSE
jgi:AmmeMemoRadiSam system protein A